MEENRKPKALKGGGRNRAKILRVDTKGLLGLTGESILMKRLGKTQALDRRNLQKEAGQKDTTARGR